MNDDYYDIDAILATQQKVPCSFKFDVPGLGHLESNDTADVSCSPDQADVDQRRTTDRAVILAS